MSWFCFSIKKERSHDTLHSEDLSGLSSSKNVRLFSYKELVSATNSFHPRNKIGRGGFGTVFKGTLRDGSQVAAKVLSSLSKQGLSEFLTEIDTITNIKHPNLVPLIGCCVEDNNRILVYELLENSSVHHALLEPDRETDLDWSRRSAICIGTARGLTFLHEEVVPHIVHRDIKASNVLLDSGFLPKIGDFGLAKLFPDNITHISTRVAGTTGYLAPDYAVGGRLTKKADVYSFGVLLLEIISGRSNSKPAIMDMDAKHSLTDSEQYLLERTWKLYEERRLVEMVDPNLKEYPMEEVLKYIKVGLFCTQAIPSRRPTMPVVLSMLSSNRVHLNEKELTPPGLIRDILGTSGSSKATTPITRFKDASYNVVSSTDVSFSEINPRFTREEEGRNQMGNQFIYGFKLFADHIIV